MKTVHKLLKPTDFRSPIHLFKIAINNLRVKGKIDVFLIHSEMANVVFGNGDSIHQGYLSLVTNHFGNYISRQGSKYRFDLDKVRNDFPSILLGHNRKVPPLVEIQMALQSEREAVMRHRSGRIIEIKQITEIGEDEQYYFYSIILYQEQDIGYKFYEGMPLTIAIDKYRVHATALDYDEAEGRLTIRAGSSFANKAMKYNRARIVIDALWLLEKLKDAIQSIDVNQFPANKLLSERLVVNEVCDNNTIYKGILDESQIAAVSHCLGKDITALWGPPGTGKTTTLGHLILTLFLKGERTLVCSIANVAIDALVKSTLKTFHRYETSEKPLDYHSGKLIRVGYTTDLELQNNTEIKLNSAQVRKISKELRKVKKELQIKENDVSDVARLKSTRLDLINKLEHAKNLVIDEARVVFATSSMIEIKEYLRRQKFDNIIIDEASMMAPPHLLAISNNISRRVIIAGDFRQLGPIALSQSEYSYKWLHRDLFEFFGIDSSEDDHNNPALTTINNQRRFHDEICQLINGTFYGHMLKSKTDLSNLKLYKRPPWNDNCIAYCDLSADPNFEVQRTKEQSRCNHGSSIFIVRQIVKPLQKHPLRTPFTIHIITPYRGQVNTLKNDLKLEITDEGFRGRIKVGTVHSFQGSEADLIIFDLVESVNEKIGRLFWQQMGERLVNVAVSRTTGKLIVVGDVKVITEGDGYMNVSSKVRMVLKEISKHRVTC